MVKSRWIPLESNPEIFNSWANSAGLVASSAQFGDIYGLDDELLAMVPQPIKALILAFPSNEISRSEARKEEEARLSKEREENVPSEIDPTVIWIKQTISNACGTMALLHALMNTDVVISPKSAIEKFIDECKEKTPMERAELLKSTSVFTSIHHENASQGQSTIPSDLKVDPHYTCFIEAPAASIRLGKDLDEAASGERGMRLLELDGDRGGIVDHGACTDLLRDAAKVIKEQFISKSTSINFNMMYLGNTME